MSILLSAAMRAYKAGFKRPVAGLASLYLGRLKGRNQRFAIDDHGHWVNRQPGATIVSMIPHTATYAEYRKWVLDNWAFDYEPQLGDTVIDVGAGVGEEAVVFSQLVGPMAGSLPSKPIRKLFPVCLKPSSNRATESSQFAPRSPTGTGSRLSGPSIIIWRTRLLEARAPRFRHDP